VGNTISHSLSPTPLTLKSKYLKTPLSLISLWLSPPPPTLPSAPRSHTVAFVKRVWRVCVCLFWVQKEKNRDHIFLSLSLIIDSTWVGLGWLGLALDQNFFDDGFALKMLQSWCVFSAIQFSGRQKETSYKTKANFFSYLIDDSLTLRFANMRTEFGSACCLKGFNASQIVLLWRKKRTWY
jgi:hypothetical protein